MTRPRIFLPIMAALLVLLLASPAPAERFIDDSQRAISFEKPFSRIISLYGAHTENLFALGLDAEIIGVTKNEVHPPAAMTKPVFSYRADPERFIAAKPDLVLVRPMIVNGYRNLIMRLEQAGIKVISLQPRSMEDMLAYWLRLGQLTGREAQAHKMIEQFKTGQARLKALTADIPPDKRVGVYFEAIHSRMKTFAPGAAALFVLEAAGGRNLAGDARAVRGTNIAAYGTERILVLGSRIEVFLAQIGPMNRVDEKIIAESPGFRAIKAVRQGRIYLIDEQLVSRPTLRLLEGIKTIGKILYPTRFGQP